MDRKLVKILGCNVDSFTKEQAIEYIYEHRGNVLTINPEMIRNAKNNNEFLSLINETSLTIPDGIGVQIGLKILGYDVKRIAAIEFGETLISKFSNPNEKIAFIGAKKDVVELAVSRLKEKFPEMNVAYVHDGYFENDEQIISEVTDAAPSLILVALGSPKQEFFIEKLKNRLNSAVMIGLGGSFDVWSGKLKRAPKIYQKLGLEWLYRTIKEPKRLKRIVPTLPIFVVEVIKERLLRKNYAN